MKLIIDIPEHDKNVIERFVRGDGCEDFPPSIIENLIRAVYFGTPIEKHDEEIIKETVESIWGKPPYTEVLDKIRAEIERYQADCDLSCSDDANCRTCDNITFGSIYRIIDKCRKGDKE